MFEGEKVNSQEYFYKSLDLSNPDEFITRIQGTESQCITKISFTSNLGRKVEVGHDLQDDIESEDTQYNSSAPQNTTRASTGSLQMARAFEAQIPKGAQVVSLAGVYNDKKLLSLHAYYS